MNDRSVAVGAFARLELTEAIRSRWMAFAALLYVAVAGAFVWLGLRESTVLGFTGLSRVFLNVAHTTILVFPLVVLFATHGSIVRARTTGLFELLLVQPVRRADWFFGLAASRLLVLGGPVVVLLLIAGVAARSLSAEPAFVSVAVRASLITISLVFCFVGLGLYLSSWAKTAERAIVLALLLWIVLAGLHDAVLIGVLLRSPLPPEVVFFLSAINPSQAARIALLSTMDPELSVLGPVGFWLANTLGQRLALLFGTCWPALVGLVAFWGALRRLRLADLVG